MNLVGQPNEWISISWAVESWVASEEQVEVCGHLLALHGGFQAGFWRKSHVEMFLQKWKTGIYAREEAPRSLGGPGRVVQTWWYAPK